MSQDPNIVYVGDEEKDDIPEEGLGKALFDKLKENGNAIAQIDAVSGEEDTFLNLLSRIVRTSINMRQRGVKPGDIIAVCDYNHLNTSVPFMATLFLGAIATAADHNLNDNEMTLLIKNIDAKFIFVSSKTEELLVRAIKKANVGTQIIVFDQSKYGNICFEDFLIVDPKEEETFEPTLADNLQDTALVLFSSGSTGQPKGVCLNHYSLLFETYNSTWSLALANFRLLQFSSMYWLSRIYMTFMSIFFRYTLIVTPEFNEELACEWISKYRVSSMILSPVHAIKLFRSQQAEKADFSSLKSVLLGGNKITEQVLIELKNKVPNTAFIQGWSLTEHAGRGVLFGQNELSQIPADKVNRAIGKPAKSVRYKIVDVETGKTLGPNQPGEMRVKSKIQMNGYFGIDSSNAWDKDGFLKTGDMMYYDEDLYFYYVERIGEMFKYRTDYVYPNLIEDAFLSHPAVKIAVVVGLSHPEDGHRPAAMVMLKNTENGKVTPEELRAYVEEKTNHRIPLSGGVMIVDQLPEASSGKTKRKIIRDILSGKN